MKQPAKADARPKTLDTLVSITDLALAHRFTERPPTLGEVARMVGVASRVLHIRDLDERISCENAAVVEIAKRLNVISA
jgi:hypothetical protein